MPERTVRNLVDAFPEVAVKLVKQAKEHAEKLGNQIKMRK